MRWIIATIALFALLAWAAAQNGSVTGNVVDAANPDTVLGTATAQSGGDGVTVGLEIDANDVISGGEHAIHVHQNPDCGPADSDGDGTPEDAGAAGGHFNPTDAGHGEDDGPHVGDSENYNYAFEDDGSFSGEVRFPQASLDGGETSFLSGGGTALVIHQGTDDRQTNPGGNSGPRIACAVLSDGGA